MPDAAVALQRVHRQRVAELVHGADVGGVLASLPWPTAGHPQCVRKGATQIALALALCGWPAFRRRCVALTSPSSAVFRFGRLVVSALSKCNSKMHWQGCSALWMASGSGVVGASLFPVRAIALTAVLLFRVLT